RIKRIAILPVFSYLALDRNEIRKDVAVSDNDALGLGSRPGSEQYLGDIVSRDRQPGRRSSRPGKIREPPGAFERRDFVANQQRPRMDDGVYSPRQVGRRAIVDRN